MLPKAITVPFQWWAKHPWIAFGGITLLGLFSIIIDENTDHLDFAYPIYFPLLVIAWILSWCRGVFVTWQRSKVEAVLAGAAIAITCIGLTIPMIAGHLHPRNPDAAVRTNIKYAAMAQEDYFVDHDTYTSNIGSLKAYGFKQDANVNITMEATKLTFVITGTRKWGYNANTGTWSFISTTGAIDGTPCR